MIPDAAIEAARPIVLPYVDDDHFDLQSILRTALEAAAPHMLAGAWDDGHAAGHLDYYAGEEAESNPYGAAK